MSVVASNEDLGACRRQLRIEVPEAAVAAETDRVLREFRRRARIKGFRKGKVPMELVRQRYHEEIEQEVIERLVPRYWRQAQAEAELEPLLPPELSDVELQPGASLTFAATVDVRPEIVLGDLGGFELPEMAVDPEAAAVDRTIDELRRRVGQWKETERPAARGDRVEGRLSEAGASSEAETADDVAFEVGDPNIWEELSLAVTGAKAGSEQEFSRRQDGPDGPGEERRFLIRIERVKELELPPLDDETASRIGDFATVEALRTAVEEQLRQRNRQERRRKRETAMLDQLCERHPLELPERVVRQETESMLREYAEELARRGVDVEKAEIDWRRLAGEFEPQARRRVQIRLLLDAAAEKLEAGISESEFEGQLGLLAKAQGTTTPSLRRALDRDGGLEELRQRFVRGKVVDRLLGDEPPEGPVVEAAPEARGEEE